MRNSSNVQYSTYVNMWKKEKLFMVPVKDLYASTYFYKFESVPL